jgi:glycine cleavage system transcriptional repressor
MSESVLIMELIHPIRIVISTIGKDQPGLVARMCEAITQAQGNIVDSTMTRLGGQFAMIYIVTFESRERLTQFKQACVQFEDEGLLSVDIQRLPDTSDLPHADQHDPPGHRKYLLSVGGYDRTGITYAFSKELASFGINITDVNAHRISGEAGTVYMLAIEMECPLNVDETAMKHALENLGNQLSLDVRLRSMDAIIL